MVSWNVRYLLCLVSHLQNCEPETPTINFGFMSWIVAVEFSAEQIIAEITRLLFIIHRMKQWLEEFSAFVKVQVDLRMASVKRSDIEFVRSAVKCRIIDQVTKFYFWEKSKFLRLAGNHYDVIESCHELREMKLAPLFVNVSLILFLLKFYVEDDLMSRWS